MSQYKETPIGRISREWEELRKVESDIAEIEEKTEEHLKEVGYEF
jgi:hypothetical protein